VTTPTAAQLQAAFNLVRGDDWPVTLLELQLAEGRMAVVEGAAMALARGQRVLPRQGLLDAAVPPVRTFDHPARLAGARPTTPTRRRTDGLDAKRLAAGERDDD
jgi:hypothetical protein